MKIIRWIGIDDHADKWTIAHFKGNEEKPTREFELVLDAAGYRKLIKYLKELGGEIDSRKVDRGSSRRIMLMREPANIRMIIVATLSRPTALLRP